MPTTIRGPAREYCVCMSVEKKRLFVLMLIILLSVILPFVIVPLLFMLPLYMFVFVALVLVIVWAFRISRLRRREEPEED